MQPSERLIAGGVALAGLTLGAVACSDSSSDDAVVPDDPAPVDLVVEAQDTPAVHVTTNGQHVGIETSGVGTVEVEPDVADLRLGVSVIRPSADAANADAAEKAAIVVADSRSSASRRPTSRPPTTGSTRCGTTTESPATGSPTISRCASAISTRSAR